MAQKGDVELVVRMRNEASKALDSITNALDKLTATEGKLASSTDAAGSSLSKFATEAQTLLTRLGDTGALDRLAAGVIQAQQAFAKQEATLTESKAALAAYQAQAQAAAQAQQRLVSEQAAGATKYAEQKAALKALEVELKSLNAELKAGATNSKQFVFPTAAAVEMAQRAQEVETAIGRLRVDMTRTAAENQQVTQTLGAVNNEYRRLNTAIARTSTQVEQQTTAIASQRSGLQALGSTVNAAADAQQRLASESARAADTVAASSRNMQQQQEAQQRAAEAAANRVTVAQRLAAVEARKLAETQLAGPAATLTSAQRDAEALQQLLAVQLRAGPPTRELSNAMRTLDDSIRRATAAPIELRNAISTLNRELSNEDRTAATVSAAMSNLDAAMRRVADTSARMGSSLSQGMQLVSQTVATTEKMTQRTVQAAGSDQQAANAKQAVTDAVNKYNDSARRSLDFTQRLRGQVLSLAAAYLGLQNAVSQIGEVVKAYQTLEATQNRLGAVFGGNQQAAANEMDFLRRTADRLGISFQTLADEYGKFAVATQGTALAGENTRKVFLAVAEAGRVNKLTIDQMQGTYLALTQMVSKGKIMSEELVRQLGDRLPGAVTLMANGLGKTTAELMKMMELGQVSANNLIYFADALNEKFGAQLSKSLTSMTTQMGRFQNNVYQARLAFGEGGFIESFTAALIKLNEYMASSDFESFIKRVSSAMGSFVTVLMAIPEHMRALTIATAAYVGLRFGTYVTESLIALRALRAEMAAARAGQVAFTAAAGTSRTSILAAAAATRNLGAAMAALGGPIGLAITAIATGLAVWATRTDDATESMSKHRKIVDDVKDSYEKAGKNADAWAAAVKNTTETQARANAASQKQVFANMVNDMAATQSAYLRVTETHGNAGTNDKSVLGQIRQQLDDLKSGKTTLADFNKQLDEINKSTENPAIRKWILKLLNLSDAAKEQEAAVRDANAALKAFTSTGDDRKGALDDLAGELDKTGESASQAAKKMEELKKVQDHLMLGIPSLEAEGKRAKALRELEDERKKAELILGDARNPGELDAKTKALFTARAQAIEDEYQKALLKAAPAIGKGVIERIMLVESGNRADATNKRSSAGGLGQFLDSTWIEQFKKVFPQAAATMNDAAILQYKTGEQYRDEQKKILENFTAENVAKIIKGGFAPSAENVYLSHFLGSAGALSVLNANKQDPNTDLAKVVSKRAITDNPEVFKTLRTTADILKWAATKMGGGASLNEKGQTDVEDEAGKKRDREKAALERINKQWDEKVNKMKLSNTEADVQNALIETGLTLESEAGQALAQKIRDANAVRDAEEKTNVLMEQRALIVAQINQVTSTTGDLDKMVELNAQLGIVNSQLDDSITKTVALWQAIGGPQADSAIAKWKQQRIALEGNLQKPLFSVQTTIDDIANQGANAFQSMASNIWDAVDGTKSWGDALRSIGGSFAQAAAQVLLNIAKMIAQAAIFNALMMVARSFGFSMPGFGAAAGAASSATASTMGGTGMFGVGGAFRLPLNHSGGMAGQAGSVSLSAASVFDALAYDNGGLGNGRPLAPNEELSVLKSDEEVLTTSDPRHRRNGGAGGATSPLQVKIINAIDSGSVVSEGLNSAQGEQAIMNYMRANARAIKGILSN